MRAGKTPRSRRDCNTQTQKTMNKQLEELRREPTATYARDTLLAEAVALRAENARLRAALERIVNSGNLDCGTFWKVDSDDIAAATAALAGKGAE